MKSTIEKKDNSTTAKALTDLEDQYVSSSLAKMLKKVVDKNILNTILNEDGPSGPSYGLNKLKEDVRKGIINKSPIKRMDIHQLMVNLKLTEGVLAGNDFYSYGYPTSDNEKFEALTLITLRANALRKEIEKKTIARTVELNKRSREQLLRMLLSHEGYHKIK